ncbi:MAG TPA: hypothetical protein VEA63_17170 [Opitutus sp.]|nr:hypothetical protein [Opitutus sp.]
MALVGTNDVQFGLIALQEKDGEGSLVVPERAIDRYAARFRGARRSAWALSEGGLKPALLGEQGL